MKSIAAKLILAALFGIVAAPAFAKESKPQPQVGELPPSALGKDREGNPVTVGEYRGKVLIVTFWASWCGPCRHELPILGRLQSAIGKDAVEVVAVNFREERQDFNAVVRANRNLPLRFISDSRGVISDTYGVTHLPNMFVIDAEGKVAHVHLGYSPEMLPGFLDEIIAMLPAEVRNRPARTEQ